HAVEFSRNGRFLRTHPLGLSSGLFPSVFRVSSLADPFSVSATRWSGLPGRSSLSRFPFRRFRLYQILSGLIPSQRELSSRLLGRSDE
ncbi:hypothetical protein ACFVGW_31675, partial [Streptomyces sp. NPDC127129]|uniref:hypothetical protein n=1 Tax=Streptomyces sp. NPDC127129 TaxID=3345373 RepID=UPI003636AE51